MKELKEFATKIAVVVAIICLGVIIAAKFTSTLTWSPHSVTIPKALQKFIQYIKM